MGNVLQSKRESSRFQILVEIAAHQPNLRQKEVADKLGVTPQAISEYIKELVADGLVTTDGRMRYSITKEGVEWLLESAAELKRYARVVMEEIISHVSVWTALAELDVAEGERVGRRGRPDCVLDTPGLLPAWDRPATPNQPMKKISAARRAPPRTFNGQPVAAGRWAPLPFPFRRISAGSGPLSAAL